MQDLIPVLPRAVTFALRPVPLAAFRAGAKIILDRVVSRHPGLLKRLGPYRDKLFLIDPVDLPFVFRLRLGPGRPLIDAGPRRADAKYDARITGPLAALIGLVHGAYDGDALFFSRDLVIEGNTEAIVALRNAIDDAELDLVAETASVLGPFGDFAERTVRIVLPAFERLTGVALSRARRVSA